MELSIERAGVGRHKVRIRSVGTSWRPAYGFEGDLALALNEALALDMSADTYLDERGKVETPWGPCDLVQIGRYDGRRMSWRSIWQVFSLAFPGRWALQAFPPEARLVDGVNAYHLVVLPEGVTPGWDLKCADETAGGGR